MEEYKNSTTNKISRTIFFKENIDAGECVECDLNNYSPDYIITYIKEAVKNKDFLRQAVLNHIPERCFIQINSINSKQVFHIILLFVQMSYGDELMILQENLDLFNVVTVCMEIGDIGINDIAYFIDLLLKKQLIQSEVLIKSRIIYTIIDKLCDIDNCVFYNILCEYCAYLHQQTYIEYLDKEILGQLFVSLIDQINKETNEDLILFNIKSMKRIIVLDEVIHKDIIINSFNGCLSALHKVSFTETCFLHMVDFITGLLSVNYLLTSLNLRGFDTELVQRISDSNDSLAVISHALMNINSLYFEEASFKENCIHVIGIFCCHWGEINTKAKVQFLAFIAWFVIQYNIDKIFDYWINESLEINELLLFIIETFEIASTDNRDKALVVIIELLMMQYTDYAEFVYSISSDTIDHLLEVCENNCENEYEEELINFIHELI